MSKFGAHISAGNHMGLSAALQQCYQANSPIPLLFALDQDVWPDVQRYSPSTLVIFRTQPAGRDFPSDIYIGDPINSANVWYAASKPKWLLNHAYYYAPTNERNPNKNSAAQNGWCDTFDLRLMQLADADGLKLALHGDSPGTPDYSDWQYYRASLAYASANGHILHLHEPVTGDDLALRYRDVHLLTQSFAPNLKIAISECYGDELGDWPAYVDSFIPYDVKVMQDSYNLGFCGYQLGGAENWFTEIPRWANYVSTHPTPVAPPPPPPDPNPIITEHYFTNIVTQSDEAAAVLQTAIDDYGLSTIHYTRRVR